VRVHALAALLLAFAACQQPSGPPTGVRARVEAEKRAVRLPVLGERRLAGELEELRTSPDGAWLTVLLDPRTPAVPGAPAALRVGELWVVPVEGGAATRAATGVTNQPGGWLATPDSRWLLALSGWDARTQLGALEVIDPRAPAAQRSPLGAAVSYFVPSDDGRLLAWVEGGVLWVGPLPAGPWRQVAGEVSTAEFSPDGAQLYFRRRHAAAGGLYQVDLATAGGEPRRLLDLVADYSVLRSGRTVVATARSAPTDRTFGLWVLDAGSGKARRVSGDAQRFRVSRDGKVLAWRTSSARGDQEVGELWLAPLAGGAPRRVGEVVRDFEFAPDSRRLVFRDHYQELPLGGREARAGEARLEKVGDLSEVMLPDGAPVVLQRLSPNYLFSPDGSALAYTARIERPEVTRRLFLRQGEGKPRVLQDWLYEYQFRPPGAELFYRADCLRDGRACSLLATGVDAAEGSKPRKEADQVFGARFSADGSRVLLGFAHLTDETFDLAVKDLGTGVQTPVDQYTAWPGLILGPRGQWIAYLVHERSRAGVYLAKAP
jgi:hypothetical protein